MTSMIIFVFHIHHFMKFFYILLFPASIWLVSGCVRSETPAEQDLLKFVNPFIGTGGHGHTYPGAATPFGMVQLSPDTRLEGWDGCSGYHFSDSILYGFSHTHLSGTGVPDYGDVLCMPFTGAPIFHNGADGNPGYNSPFDKNSEQASPGYYAVTLKKYDIRAELTATPRTGIHRYTFPANDTAGLLFDLVHRDEVLDASLRIISPTEIEGYRFSKAWAENQRVYFVARFSKPVIAHQMEGFSTTTTLPDSLQGKTVRAAFHFAPSSEPLVIQVGISAVDIQGARQNLEAENVAFNFEEALEDTRNLWNDQLRSIEVKMRSEQESGIFYTALYHASLQPNLFTDADGRYRGVDDKVHEAKSHTQYTVFSLWDTYRAAHPLYNIIAPDRSRDFIHTFLQHYRQRGELPVWELAGNETYCMIGYHAASVIADAYRKGIRDFDSKLALEAMVATAEKDHLGKNYYREYGFVPAEKEAESVSKTLEYAYDDWCIAQFAADLGNEKVHDTFSRRAQQYQNLFDASTGFFRARRNQTWIAPFNPYEVNYHFTEANAWQYGYYAPQDISGWMALLGGPEKMAKHLDALFGADTKTAGRDQVDITGLIGQYAHGNEPSHHIAYLYSFCGQPWKTQERIHDILRTQYSDAPDGLSGNEDCGQMSAWYIFSALGFYPVTPGSTDYIIGSPLVEEAEIPLANGKTFRIAVRNGGEKTPYIQSVKWQGRPYTKSYFSHEDLLGGGTLEFEMGAKPNTAWGTGKGDLPSSRISGSRILPLPVVSRGKRAFFEKDTLELSHPFPDAEIRYTTDGTDPAKNGEIYSKALYITSDTELRAIARHSTYGQSAEISARFLKVPANRSLKLAFPYAVQYSASGPSALIDFLQGGNDYRTGEWQGFEGVDVDAVVDLGAEESVRSVGIRFLQDENAWIFMPLRVLFFYSKDGKQFLPLGEKNAKTQPDDKGTRVEEFAVKSSVRARYIKVLGVNRGLCPPWHKGAGGKAWMFADEITIE